MPTTVVVELTGDEQKLVQSFRRAEAADRKARANFEKTGETMEGAAADFAKAYAAAGSKVNTSLDKIFRNMKKSGSETSKLAKGIQDDLAQAGQIGSEEFLAHIRKLDPELADKGKILLQGMREADRDANFDHTLSEIEKLGGAFGQFAKEAKKDLNASAKSGSELVRELRAIDPDKAERLADAMRRAQAAVKETELNELMSEMSQLGGEAARVVSIIRDDMKKAAVQAEGGLEGMRQKLIAMHPAARAAFEQVGEEMAEAARYGEGEFEDVLNTLRAADPVSKKAAEEIKRHLVGAGLIVERQFKDMIKPLHDIDPALAMQATKIHRNLEKIEGKNKSVWKRISTHAIAQIGSIATAYLGANEALQLFLSSLKEQQGVGMEASEAIKAVATSQQEARKNLDAFTSKQQSFLLEGFVEKVSREARFADLPQIVKAVGDAASAGGSLEGVKSAVMTSAKMNRMTPEVIDKVAAALIDLERATGNASAEMNASTLVLAGSQARIIDPAKLARNIAPAMFTASKLVGEDASAAMRERASMQGAALFAAFSRAATDPVGDASATASIQFATRMRGFFQNLGKDASEAQAKLSELQKSDPLNATQRFQFEQLRKQEASAADTDTRLSALRAEYEGIKKSEIRKEFTDDKAKQDARLRKMEITKEMQSLEQVEFSESDAARLKAFRDQFAEKDREYQAEKAELQGAIAAANIKGFKGQIPKSMLGQLQALRENKSLADAFYFAGDKFGEQRFRPAQESIITGGAAFVEFEKIYKLLQSERGSTTRFENLLRDLDSGTAQQRFASRTVTQQAAEERLKVFGLGGRAELSRFREDLKTTLEQTRRPGGAQAFDDSLQEIMIESGRLSGSTLVEEAIASLHVIGERSRRLRTQQSITQEDLYKIDRLEEQRGAALRAISSDNAARTITTANLEGVIQGIEKKDRVLRYDPKAGRLVDMREELLTALEQTLEKSREIDKQNKIPQETLEAQREQNRLIERQNELLAAQLGVSEDTADAAAATAENTAPVEPRRTPAMGRSSRNSSRRRAGATP